MEPLVEVHHLVASPTAWSVPLSVVATVGPLVESSPPLVFVDPPLTLPVTTCALTRLDPAIVKALQAKSLDQGCLSLVLDLAMASFFP